MHDITPTVIGDKTKQERKKILQNASRAVSVNYACTLLITYRDFQLISFFLFELFPRYTQHWYQQFVRRCILYETTNLLWLHLQSLSLHWRPASRRSYVTRIRWWGLLAYTNDSTSVPRVENPNGWPPLRGVRLSGIGETVSAICYYVTGVKPVYRNVVRYLKVDGAELSIFTISQRMIDNMPRILYYGKWIENSLTTMTLVIIDR